MKLLGIDYGSKRTGLAVSDSVGVTCRPLSVVVEREMGALISTIIQTAADQEVEGMVVGMPRPLSGGTNRQLEDVLRFVDDLRNGSPLPVNTWDERFTSVLAGKGRAGVEELDAIAACYMLQSYLDMLSGKDGGDLGSRRPR